MAETKDTIKFGSGTLAQAYLQIGKDSNILAFGNDDEGHGGIIVARGKLVSPKLLDAKIDDNAKTITFYFVGEDPEDNSKKIISETVSFKAEATLSKEDKEALVAEVKEALDNNIVDTLIKDETFKTNITNAVKEEVENDIASINDHVNSGTFVQASESSPITVTASEGEQKTYTVDIAVDDETIKVQDGKLTAVIPNYDDLVVTDGVIKNAEFEGVEQLCLVLTIANSENEVVIPVKDLVDTYTSDDDYVHVEDYKISLNINQLKDAILGTGEDSLESKVAKITSDLYDAPAEGGDPVLPGLISNVRETITEVATMKATVETLTEKVIGNGDTSNIEELEQKVAELESKVAEGIVWSNLSDLTIE